MAVVLGASVALVVPRAAMAAEDDAPKKAGDDAGDAASARSTKKSDAKGDDKAQDDAAATDVGDVTELAHKTYYFVGARYRGTIVPKFMMNLFVDEGGTFYSNTVGVELDMRKDGESKIFALNYVEYGMGDTLFLQKGKPATDEGNWSYVNSSLKGIYATVDLLWSAPIARQFDFEYGFGAGIGFIFGDLVNNWVYRDPNGPLVDSTGQHWGKCTGNGQPATNSAGSPTQGCSAADHQNATTIKAAPGGYVEPTWFSGGSVPNVFLHLAFPELGIRYKVNRDIETRLGFGFSLTGFWFGLSADYGLPSNKEKTGKNAPTFRFGNASQPRTF